MNISTNQANMRVFPSSSSVSETAPYFGSSPDYHALAETLNQSTSHDYLDLNKPEVKAGLPKYIAGYNQLLQQLPESTRQKIAQNPLGKAFLEVIEKAQQGELNSEDILNLQAFIQGAGIDIGGDENVSGMDGLFGPRTFQGLNDLFEKLTESPDQVFEQVSIQNQWIQQEVSNVKTHLNAAMNPTEVDFSSSSVSPPSAAQPTVTSGGLINTGRKDIHGRDIALTPEAAEGFNKILDAARQSGIRVEVFSSTRSIEKQRQLFAQAVKKYGSESAARKWVAPPGKSRHNFGNAIDMNMFRNGKKISQREFDRIIAQAGMYRPMSYETWHIEPLSTRGNRG